MHVSFFLINGLSVFGIITIEKYISAHYKALHKQSNCRKSTRVSISKISILIFSYCYIYVGALFVGHLLEHCVQNAVALRCTLFHVSQFLARCVCCTYKTMVALWRVAAVTMTTLHVSRISFCQWIHGSLGSGPVKLSTSMSPWIIDQAMSSARAAHYKKLQKPQQQYNNSVLYSQTSTIFPQKWILSPIWIWHDHKICNILHICVTSLVKQIKVAACNKDIKQSVDDHNPVGPTVTKGKIWMGVSIMVFKVSEKNHRVGHNCLRKS